MQLPPLGVSGKPHVTALDTRRRECNLHHRESTFGPGAARSRQGSGFAGALGLRLRPLGDPVRVLRVKSTTSGSRALGLGYPHSLGDALHFGVPGVNPGCGGPEVEADSHEPFSIMGRDADKQPMIEPTLGNLAEELSALEAEEAQVSAERRRLQQQIDNGFATEASRTREREASLRRRELHLQIDAIRLRLGLPAGPRPRAADQPGLERSWSLESRS
jgi:hypothetical protein